MLPLAKYIKLLIIKHTYRNSLKLGYTLTFSIHLPVFSTDFGVVSQNFKVAGGCMASVPRAQAPRGVRGHAPLENF